MQPVKRRIGFDDVDEANEEIAALLAVLADLHTRLNAAGVPPDGTLSERVQALLKRLRRLEADRDMQRARLIESSVDLLTWNEQHGNGFRAAKGGQP